MLPAKTHANPARPPSVDKILQTAEAQVLAARFGRRAVTDGIRAQLLRWRNARAAGAQNEIGGLWSAEEIARYVGVQLEQRNKPSQRRLMNLSGTVLHTNLGRALLPESAVAAVAEAMRYPTNLEFNLETDARGERDDHVRKLICELTGAEDACLVNNNAAAVLLVLATFAFGKETVVSRGELIEIGGSFRLPEIMRRAGTHLREVGATNRTHLADYEHALSPQTGLILKAHTSNYAIQGFTSSVSGAALANLAQRRGLPFFNDLGSGVLIDLAAYGLPPEQTVQEALREGADLVSFSGDKLLGGPQCGFIVGRADLVRKCAHNHLKRSLRLDKLRLAALEATLRLYRHPERLTQELPTLRFLTRPQAEVQAQAESLSPLWQAALGENWICGVCDCKSQIGSGALPLDSLPSAALFATPQSRRKGAPLNELTAYLHKLPIPIIGRIKDDKLLLDLRCLEDEAAFGAQLVHLKNLIAAAA